MDCMEVAAEPPPAVVMNPLDATLAIVLGAAQYAASFRQASTCT